MPRLVGHVPVSEPAPTPGVHAKSGTINVVSSFLQNAFLHNEFCVLVFTDRPNGKDVYECLLPVLRVADEQPEAEKQKIIHDPPPQNDVLVPATYVFNVLVLVHFHLLRSLPFVVSVHSTNQRSLSGCLAYIDFHVHDPIFVLFFLVVLCRQVRKFQGLQRWISMKGECFRLLTVTSKRGGVPEYILYPISKKLGEYKSIICTFFSQQEKLNNEKKIIQQVNKKAS